MQDVFLSVIIPTYNRAEFLEETVGSVFRQGISSVEVLIVDDHSTDHTAEVVASIQEKYPGILYLLNRGKKGPAGARNTALSLARGKYLAFLDSDNVYYENSLRRHLQLLEENPDIDVICGNFNFVDYQSGEHFYDFLKTKCRLLWQLPLQKVAPGVFKLESPLFEVFLKDSFFSFPAAVIRHSVVGEALLDERVFHYEDRDFAIQLAKKRKAVFAVSEIPVFKNYVHSGNMSKTFTPQQKIGKLKDRILIHEKYLSWEDLSKKEYVLLQKSLSSQFRKLTSLYLEQNNIIPAWHSMLKSLKYETSMDTHKMGLKLMLLTIFGFVFRWKRLLGKKRFKLTMGRF